MVNLESRIFKFRAWLKPTKQMATVTGINLVGSVDFRVLTPDNQTIWFGGENPNAVVMQFTGLLDKTGKEIFEGDLIKANTPYSTEEAKQVFWDKERAGFFLKCRYAAYDRKNLYKMSAFKMEIIGNVYQNPELLEEVTL